MEALEEQLLSTCTTGRLLPHSSYEDLMALASGIPGGGQQVQMPRGAMWEMLPPSTPTAAQTQPLPLFLAPEPR